MDEVKSPDRKMADSDNKTVTLTVSIERVEMGKLKEL